MSVSADLVFPANDTAELREIFSWDGLRPATLTPSEFPVDVVRFSGSSSPPVILPRGRRDTAVKALPATLRERIQSVFDRFSRRPTRLALAHGRSLDFSDGPAVMAVINVTPDSFSDGGLFFDPARAAERALQQWEAGAAIVDIGGESTRPSTYGEAIEVPAEEEIRRVVPVIERLRRETSNLISIDTRKAQVARRALAAGADLINDVSAMRFDAGMASVAAEEHAGVVLMHMRGLDPRTMQGDTAYPHPVATIAQELALAASQALEAGVSPEQVSLDPGLGFGKTPEGNLALLRHLAALHSLGFPLAIGASRKAFVRRFSGVGDDATAADRLAGSLACLSAAWSSGAEIVRVHDAADSVRFLKMLSAIRTPDPWSARPAGAAAR